MLNYKYHTSWNANLVNKYFFSSDNGNSSDCPYDAQQIIEKVLSSYDTDDCLYGLFKALSKAQPRISPFIASHDYCIKIFSCTNDGKVDFEISPIYHLGPEYPEQYKQKHGAELDGNAIIGLVEMHIPELPNSEHKKFSLGIDAGIVFKNSKIPHSKQMSLILQPIYDGIMANLTCETQTTSKKFTWKELGIEQVVS